MLEYSAKLKGRGIGSILAKSLVDFGMQGLDSGSSGQSGGHLRADDGARRERLVRDAITVYRDEDPPRRSTTCARWACSASHNDVEHPTKHDTTTCVMRNMGLPKSRRITCLTESG